MVGPPPRLAGSTRGPPSAWRSSGQPLVRPPGPVSPMHPEYCVGHGTARRRQLAEAGAGLPVRSTAARAQPLADAATQVCMAPRRGGEGSPPRLTPTPALGVVDVPARRRGGPATAATVRARGRGGRGSRGPDRRSRRRLAQALRGWLARWPMLSRQPTDPAYLDYGSSSQLQP